MDPETAQAVLNRMLDPVGRSLNAEAAERLSHVRADPIAQERIEALAAKSTAGTLTPEERADYQTFVSAAALIAILQAKARAALATLPAA